MRFFTHVCILFICTQLAWSNPTEQKESDFDLKNANQIFDRINIKLSVQNLNSEHLSAAINTLDTLTTQANKCIEIAEKRLADIDMLIQQSGHSTDKNVAGADLVYLDSEKKKNSDKLAQCRLFSIRSKEAIEAYTAAIAKLKEKETLVQSLPLWLIIGQIIDSPSDIDITFASQIIIPDALQSFLMWSLLGCASLLISTVFLYRLYKKIIIIQILLFSTFLISAALFAYLFFISQQLNFSPVLLDLSREIFTYLAACQFALFLFKLKPLKRLFKWYSLNSHFCQSALLCIFSFYSLATIANTLDDAFEINTLLWQLGETCFLIILFATELYLIYRFCYLHKHIALIKRYRLIIQRISSILLILSILITVVGYHALAIGCTLSSLKTLLIVFVTILIIQGINKTYLTLTHHQHIKMLIIKYFGYKPDDVFTEFLMLKTVAQIIVLAISIYLIVSNWGFAIYYIESAYNQLLYGVHLANITLYPTRIILGVIVYCLLYLFFRGISTAISRHQQFEEEEETQIAIASIFTYIGFGLALISALLVAGFNFKGLAIVAGALSVGIGLGLQSIVNNFVSGLILLIEKPIKPGDRINIDGIEGFVKKIRVRSTHIITPAQEDVIVPNSDLITRRVTNYVYSGKQISISCDINIPLGSDTQRIRDVLLSIANQHEDVIKSGRNKPHVLFRSFGEKGLAFQLCCLIKDVNKKLIVQSDLNFAIDQSLRENNL